MKFRLLSSFAAIFLLAMVAIMCSLAIYFTYHSFLGETQKRARVIKGFIKVESVKAGIGYIKLYVRSIDFDGKVDVVYFLDPHDYRLLALARLPQPVEVCIGKLVEITIPFHLIEYLSADAMQILGVRVEGFLYLQPLEEVFGKPVLVGVGSYSLNGVAVLAVSTKPISLTEYLRKAIKAFVGFLAERDFGGRALDMNPNRIHYVRINLVTGEYELIYIDGDDVKTASGRAKVLKDTNVIDLSKLNREERYKLGPVIVFVNPYFAAKDYEVEIIDIRGTHLKIPMEKLVDDKSLVGLDALVCWEDLWWPGTSASLDDYQDHIVRITAFTNDTVRIEIVYTEAGYIHVFFIDPPLADKGKLQDLVRRYRDNNYRLPPETGVVYVKAHNVKIPPPDSHDLWDPVAGKWVVEWPIVFYR